MTFCWRYVAFSGGDRLLSKLSSALGSEAGCQRWRKCTDAVSLLGSINTASVCSRISINTLSCPTPTATGDTALIPSLPGWLTTTNRGKMGRQL